MDVKLIRALAFHQYLLSLAVCPKAHGPESAKPAREPNVRFRTSRPQSRPSEIHPTRPFRWPSRNVRVGQVLPILAASARTVVNPICSGCLS
jgi:hypothetical protein